MRIRERKPEKGKNIRAQDQVAKKASGQEYPAISLRYLDVKWCITSCGKDGMVAFADRVRILTQKSWMELGNLPRHGQGYEYVGRDQIKAKIPTHLTDDVTRFMVFRFHGKAPMVGYKEGETFFVVWFDPLFKLYPH